MNTTKRERRTDWPKASRIITSSPIENVAERTVLVTELAADIREGITALVNSAAVRLLLVELERYERTIGRWATITPTEPQCEALSDELAGLHVRVQELAETAPRK